MARTTQRKTTRTKGRQADRPTVDDDSTAGSAAGEATGQVDEAEYLTDFAEFFDDTDQVQVSLYRVLPVHYNGLDISGFLECILPGVNLEYIAQRYGGGKYRVQARSLQTGKFLQQGYVKIAGLPVVDSPPTPSESTPTGPAETTDRVAPVLNINGVDVPADLKMIKEVLILQRLIDTLLPARTDPNIELITTLLKNGQRSGLGSINETMELIRNVKELLPAGEGDGWTGVASQGLATLRSFMERAGQPGPSGRPLIPGPTPGQMAGQPVEKQPVAQPDQQLPGEENMSATNMVEKACAYLVNGYLAGHDPAQVTETVKAVIPPISDNARQQLLDNRTLVQSVAETMLADKVEIDDDEKAKFLLTFNEVFDKLTGTESQPEESTSSK